MRNAFIVATLLPLSAPALAQRDVVAPSVLTGTIDGADRADDSGRPFEDVLIEVSARQLLTLTPDRTAGRVALEAYRVDGVPVSRSSGRLSLPPGDYRLRIVGAAGETTPYRIRIQLNHVMSSNPPGPARGDGADPSRPRLSIRDTPPSRFILCPGNPRCPR